MKLYHGTSLKNLRKISLFKKTTNAMTNVKKINNNIFWLTLNSFVQKTKANNGIIDNAKAVLSWEKRLIIEANIKIKSIIYLE